MILSARHPEGLFCPKCGCGSIIYWPELIDWHKWSNKRKATYETCANCKYNMSEENHNKPLDDDQNKSEIYCHECSKAGGAHCPVYHAPPACSGTSAKHYFSQGGSCEDKNFRYK